MVRVGVVGLGMMGLTHLDVYRKHPDVEVVAICDSDADRLSGKVQALGNVEGQAMSSVAEMDVERYSDIGQVIGNPQIGLVDICLPTDAHLRFGSEVLKAGQHLMIEKPLARTADDARKFVEAAEAAQGITFVGHCMRFWPGWTWLKEAIADERFGSVYAAVFQRRVNHPGGPFYLDGARCGGAALDLHIHDTDFIHFCFGMPQAVTSFGYSKITSEPDHLITHYQYERIPLVVAEGTWAMTDGYTFNMGFTVNFENATAVYDMSQSDPLRLYEKGKDPAVVPVEPIMGYDLEIDYMIQCIKQGRQPEVVTITDAMNTIRIIEAEVASVKQRQTVML